MLFTLRIFAASASDTIFLARSRFRCRDRDDAGPATLRFTQILNCLIYDFESRGGCLYEGDFSDHLRFFSKHRILRQMHPHVFNLYNLPFLDLLYRQLARRTRDQKGTIPILELASDDPSCLQEIARDPGAKIILGLHNGFSQTARSLSLNGCGITMIFGPSRERAVNFLRANRVAYVDRIRIVSVGRNTLIELDSSVARGDAILCAPDCVDPRTGRCDYVSSAMFQYAISKKLPLYFFDYAVTDDFKLRVFSERGVHGQTTDQAMEQFIRFCARSSGRLVRPLPRAARDSIINTS